MRDTQRFRAGEIELGSGQFANVYMRTNNAVVWKKFEAGTRVEKEDVIDNQPYISRFTEVLKARLPCPNLYWCIDEKSPVEIKTIGEEDPPITMESVLMHDGNIYKPIRLSYHGISEDNNTNYAVKEFKQVEDESLFCEHEVKMMEKVKALNSDAFVNLLFHSCNNRLSFIYMEFFNNGDLFYHLTKLPSDVSKYNICAQLYNAVFHLHENEIVHKDIKPENILIRSIYPSYKIVIGDFGGSVDLSGDDTVNVVGTLIYTSPRFAMGCLSGLQVSTNTIELFKETDMWAVILVSMFAVFLSTNALHVVVYDAPRPPKRFYDKNQIIFRKNLYQWLMNPSDLSVDTEVESQTLKKQMSNLERCICALNDITRNEGISEQVTIFFINSLNPRKRQHST